jgi:hypothetical protein
MRMFVKIITESSLQQGTGVKPMNAQNNKLCEATSPPTTCTTRRPSAVVIRRRFRPEQKRQDREGANRYKSNQEKVRVRGGVQPFVDALAHAVPAAGYVHTSERRRFLSILGLLLLFL